VRRRCREMFPATAEQEREKIGLWADGKCPTRDWTGLELVRTIVSRTKEVDEKINDEGAKVNASVISLWRQEDDRYEAELDENPNLQHEVRARR